MAAFGSGNGPRPAIGIRTPDRWRRPRKARTAVPRHVFSSRFK